MTLKLTHSFDPNNLPASVHIPVIPMTNQGYSFAQIKGNILTALENSKISEYALLDDGDGFNVHLRHKYDQTLFLFHLEGDCEENISFEIKPGTENLHITQRALFIIMQELTLKETPKMNIDSTTGTIIVTCPSRSSYIHVVGSLSALRTDAPQQQKKL